MWRSILAVVLLPSLTVAQSDVPGKTLEVKSQTNSSFMASPKVISYRSFDQLRRGTEEKVAVWVEVWGPLTSPRSPVPGVAPIKLELQPAEGFTFGPIDYPKPYRHKFAFQPERIAVFQFSLQHLEFKLRAAPDATLGNHMLAGRLTLQGVTDAGISPPQHVEVHIPVAVVDRSVQAFPARNWPMQDRMPPWNDMPIATKIVLVPLLPVLFLLSGVVCAIRGEDCRC
jgi:hypothetical protein